MLEAGSVRSKNVKNVMLKNLLDACSGAIGFYLLGWGLAYGGDDSSVKSFAGSSEFGLADNDGTMYHAWFFQFAFAATTATIVSGTVAERCSMTGYMAYSAILVGFVYPIVAHSIWAASGFLSAFNDKPFMDVGVVDFAGSGVVHMTGGCCALVAAIILGPRIGRFYDELGNPLPSPKDMPGHSTSLQMLGTFILWTGWYGFNSGSTLGITYAGAGDVASLAAVTTTLAAASGTLSSISIKYALSPKEHREYDVGAAMNGALAGLVAITAGCSVIQPGMAILTGVIAGAVYVGSSSLLVKLKIDDVVDAVPVHFFNGIWGLLAVGLFADPKLRDMTYGNDGGGLFYGDGNLLGAQCIAVLWIVAWVVVTTVPFFFVLNKLGLFRISQEEEEAGLDISKHGGSAYHTTADVESIVYKTKGNMDL